MTEHLFDNIEAHREGLVTLRRDLHAHPELAFQEERTAGIVEARLRAAGLEVRTGLAQTGVVGILRGGMPGRTVLVRADMDGLPIQEASEVPYRSRIPGCMHACGHDGHTAIAVILAEILSGRRAEMAGTLVFAFQPAEEITSGALPMIEAGVMDAPPVDAVVGLHLWNDLPVGTVALSPGPVFGSVDEIMISVEGRGGHGAIPHQAVDPIVAAAHAVTALQTIVSRETAPLDAVVVTVGTIHAGTAFNIIPDRVEMRGTVRAFTGEIRERTLRRVEEMVAAVARAVRCEATVTSRFGCPPAVNDPAVTAIVREVAATVVAGEHVVDLRPTTGSDDVAYFLQRAPGCYFAVGSHNRDRGLDAAHHNPRFDFDEEALVIGAKVLGGAALRLLE
ncbi:MAG: amidohydrolase [Armatimonadetes bacterium]|nr:amidohydrolase [Armatimonadota bacterium]